MLMQNPYAWALLSFCTLFSVILAIWTYLKGKKKLEISCFCNTNEIVKSGRKLISDLQLLYHEKTIDNLAITRYAIWNSGNDVLNYSAIVETKPLQIIVSNDDDVEILDAMILTQSEKTNNFVLEEINCKYVKIRFEYIEKNDGIVVQLIHTGGKHSLTVDCKIKGGKKVNSLNGQESKNKACKHPNKKKKSLTVFICGSSALVVIFWLFHILMMWDIIPVEFVLPIFHPVTNNSPILSTIVLIVCIIVLIFEVVSLLNYEYHFYIPTQLRDNIDFED